MPKVYETATVLSFMHAIICFSKHAPEMVRLPPERYDKLGKYLDDVTFNHLFARAVIDRIVSGQVYVDNVDDPRSIYVVHRYGMSLLCGDFTNREFNSAFRSYALNTDRTRTGHEWMQVFTSGWNSVLKELLGDKLIRAADNKASLDRSFVELNTRVNFAFDRESYLTTREKNKSNDPNIRVNDTTKDIYDQMNGAVVPKAFWNSSKQFQEKGIAYSLYYSNELAATAFSSFLAPGKVELGIETLPKFRGLGFAEEVCSALIDFCIKKKLEPIWACRLENTGSYKLAKSLGFVPVLELPYYRLSN